MAKIVNSKEFSPMLKEFVGFDVYGPMNHYEYYDEQEELDSLKQKVEVECQDSSFSFEVGYDEYTDDDKEILGSKKSCLYYAYDSLRKNFQVSHDCKTGKVLDSSKKAGIECGILEISFQSPGASGILNTCFLYSHDFYSKNTLPKGLEEVIKKELYDREDLKIEKFSISVSDGNGNNKVTINMESNCQFLSKSLLLLFLFLFLF